MTKQDAIYQLKCLRSHCGDFMDPDDEDDVWAEDIKALDIAIKELEANHAK